MKLKLFAETYQCQQSLLGKFQPRNEVRGENPFSNWQRVSSPGVGDQGLIICSETGRAGLKPVSPISQEKP